MGNGKRGTWERLGEARTLGDTLERVSDGRHPDLTS